VICCVSACILEVLVAIKLRGNKQTDDMDTSLVPRVVAFGGTILWGLVLAGITIQDWYSVVPDLCFATFGIIFFFTFASQKDIIELWRRWALALVDSGSPMTERSFALTSRETSKEAA